MSRTYPYPIDHNPRFNPNPKESFVVKIIRAILSKLNKPKV